MVDSTKRETIRPAAAEVGNVNILHGEIKQKGIT